MHAWYRSKPVWLFFIISVRIPRSQSIWIQQSALPRLWTNLSRRRFWPSKCSLLLFFPMANCFISFWCSIDIWVIRVWPILFFCIQGGSSGSAASPFGKGLSFGNLSSSSAAAAPTSSSGGVGGFGQQGFAASQASGVTMLLLCIWKPKFTTTIMSTLSSLQQHADKVYHNSYGDESSRMHACKCCYVTLSAQHSLAESLNEFFGLQVPPSLSAALAPLGGALGSPPPPPPLLAISPQVTSCPYEACNDLCHDRVLCFWPCILKAEFFTVLV